MIYKVLGQHYGCMNGCEYEFLNIFSVWRHDWKKKICLCLPSLLRKWHRVVQFKHNLLPWLHLPHRARLKKQARASSHDECPRTMPPKNTSLENIGHIRGCFQVECVMNREARAAATSYIRRRSTRTSLCPSVAVLHSYLSLLMEFNGISPALCRAQSSGGAGWEVTSGSGIHSETVKEEIHAYICWSEYASLVKAALCL